MLPSNKRKYDLTKDEDTDEFKFRICVNTTFITKEKKVLKLVWPSNSRDNRTCFYYNSSSVKGKEQMIFSEKSEGVTMDDLRAIIFKIEGFSTWSTSSND